MRRIALAVLTMALTAAAAQAAPLYDTPVYNPATQSYFEVVLIKDHSQRINGHPVRGWRGAKLAAERRAYHGVRGRLAVVRDKATNDFLRETFQNTHAGWIGLRYLCRARKLLWIDGDAHDRSDYTNWSPRWQPAVAPDCGGGYWVAYYPAVDQPFRWRMNTLSKAYDTFYVEYPTGAE